MTAVYSRNYTIQLTTDLELFTRSTMFHVVIKNIHGAPIENISLEKILYFTEYSMH